MSFARKLHEQRVKNRLSLQQVADAVDISKAHVWNLEKALTTNPSMDLVMKFAELFRVRVTDLVGEGPDETEEEPEIVAMFRDLKQLDERDRETIAMLMEQMKRRKDDAN